MNQKIFMAFTSGKTCWLMSFNPNGKVLDVVAKNWVDFVLDDLSTYFIMYTEVDSTGLYVADYPSDFVLDVLQTEVSYQQAGATPTLPDDGPPIGIGQSQGSSVAAINYSVAAAQNLSESSKTIVQGIVQIGSNTITQIATDLDGATDNLYRGRVIIFTSGDAIKSAAIIKTYNATTKILTFTGIPVAPIPDDTFL